MGRIVAISGGELEDIKPIKNFGLSLIGTDSRNVLIVGAASCDSDDDVGAISEIFYQLGCCVRRLELVKKSCTEEEISSLVSWADVIYISGGDTIFMMEVWKKYGFDALLKEVYEKDSAVLMGISAGAICWFDCGCTDSRRAASHPGLRYGWANEMLGLYHYAFCPHYATRVSDFEVLMKEKNVIGLALEDNTAFAEVNGKISFIKSKESAKAYTAGYENGTFIRREIELTLI